MALPDDRRTSARRVGDRAGRGPERDVSRASGLQEGRRPIRFRVGIHSGLVGLRRMDMQIGSKLDPIWSIVTDAPIPIFFKDVEGHYLFVNAAYEEGLYFHGDIDIPIIDWRHYLERQLDMHNSHQSFASRQRMRDHDHVTGCSNTTQFGRVHQHPSTSRDRSDDGQGGHLS